MKLVSRSVVVVSVLLCFCYNFFVKIAWRRHHCRLVARGNDKAFSVRL